MFDLNLVTLSKIVNLVVKMRPHPAAHHHEHITRKYPRAYVVHLKFHLNAPKLEAPWKSIINQLLGELSLVRRIMQLELGNREII